MAPRTSAAATFERRTCAAAARSRICATLGVASDGAASPRFKSARWPRTSRSSGAALRSAVGEIDVSDVSSPQVAGGSDLGSYALHFRRCGALCGWRGQRRPRRHRRSVESRCLAHPRAEDPHRDALRHRRRNATMRRRRCASELDNRGAVAPARCTRTNPDRTRIHILTIVMRVTDLTYGPFIVDPQRLARGPWMLLLALIARLCPAPREQSDQGILPWYPGARASGSDRSSPWCTCSCVMWQG